MRELIVAFVGAAATIVASILPMLIRRWLRPKPVRGAAEGVRSHGEE